MLVPLLLLEALLDDDPSMPQDVASTSVAANAAKIFIFISVVVLIVCTQFSAKIMLFSECCLRNGVITRAAPWVAAEDALEGKPEAFDRTVLAEGFKGVLGAGGCETAYRRLERGDADLVELDQQDERRSQYSLERGHYSEILAFRVERMEATSSLMML